MSSASEFNNSIDQWRKSSTETGHAKNVANFLRLISFCQNLQTTYNPSNERLKIPHLLILYQNAFEKLNEVYAQKSNFDTHTHNRRNAFEDLKPFCTKIINAFAVSGVNKSTLEEAKAINKKIQGVVLKSSLTSINEGKTSTSQQSYDQKIEHFSTLIEILKQNPIYNPNEQELKITSLEQKLSNLQMQNLNLIHSYTLYSNALQIRNQILYNSETGLVQKAKKIKQYIKSIFGTNSSQYLQIRSLEFKVRTGE
ncbi:hypothetical protein LZZ90_06705 [Flavobacterium sp. SM15]|uniref:hypothetical protein n=1 Tax=Flavobacterium sp. SM15 TaxID=2908005 RepID=UPI001EDC095C|nr:hypothetical protein [Flavobacterium sp. SM15]MCG2611192.1 hypothetical protein [Flavobacterium sp. SM15]